MGNRLSKIYTRTGDDGTTGLANGDRITKTSPRIEAMGAVDELNSIIGLLITEPLPTATCEILSEIQHALFDLGGEISLPGEQLMNTNQVTRVEMILDEMNELLPPLKEFILPGGTRSAALCHQARSVCRRAERRLLALVGQQETAPVSAMYLNRLSDLFFVMARNLNARNGEADIFWRKSFKPN